MFMQNYIQNSFVSKEALLRVETCLSELNEYITRFPDVLKLTVCLTGSYSTGLAARNGSSIDLVVCMDGGSLTDGLNGHHLAVALSTGLNDWEFLSSLNPSAPEASLLIADTIDSSIKLKIRACKPSNFPLNHLYHSRLLSSYAFCDPRHPALVGLIKQWACSSGFSTSIPSSHCPLSGFHWTIIVTAFLIGAQIVPNLHQASAVVRELPRDQYGPRPEKDAYIVVPDAAAGKRLFSNTANLSVTVSQLAVDFFRWLSLTDLLAWAISLQAAGPADPLPSPKRGWIVIADPALPGIFNTVDPTFDQKGQVVFAMKLQREAAKVFETIREGDERVLTGILSSHGEPRCVKVDKAAP